MMERKEIIKNLLLISCVIILFFLCAFVLSIINPGLLEGYDIFLRSAFFVIVTSMVIKLIYQIYGKPLTQEMKEEEIKEADQKDRKQLLFKPPTGISIFFLFLILAGIGCFIIQVIFPLNHHADWSVGIVGFLFLTGLSLFLWYSVPVFIFEEDLVQIKPYLFYVFGIDRKTIFRYVDIISVSPDAEFKNNKYGFDSRYQIGISTNGTLQKYSLTYFDSEIIAKIYLRFKEKLGDKVTLQ
jgi:hypothetical protein